MSIKNGHFVECSHCRKLTSVKTLIEEAAKEAVRSRTAGLLTEIRKLRGKK